MISSPIEEIKNRLDIVDVIRNYIKLEKAGANYRALCPFHSEKKPSFFVSPARQIWHCFGCSKGGDMFRFIMEIEGVEFGDALRILAQKAGVELKKEDPKIKTQRRRFYEINQLACKFFEHQLEKSQAGQEAKKYLLKRGLKEETIKEWRLGYAPDVWRGLSDFLVGKGYKREEIEKTGLCLKSEKTGNYYDRFRGRIMFPVFNLSSQVVGFGGRIFKQKTRPDNQEEAKYINIPNTLLYDKSRILYGLHKAGLATRKEDFCILVEGYIDVIMAHQAGTENVVATSGTALTPHHLNLLKRYSENIFTAFDMDIAGNSATKRSIDLAQAMGFNIKVITMPQDSDPADVVAENPEKWKELIKNAKSIYDFYFENTLSKFDKNTLEGKKEISKILLPVIKKIPNKIEQTVWIQGLADVLGVKEEDVLEELKKVKVERLEEKKETSSLKQNQALPKNRKELLEEYLLSLLFKNPDNLKFIEKEHMNFLSPVACEIIALFRKHGREIEKNLPENLKEPVNFISLRAEVEEIESEEELEKEFQNCLKEIKTLFLRNKLAEISKEIKKAEKEHNFQKLQGLIQKFNSYSKWRSDLETA